MPVLMPGERSAPIPHEISTISDATWQALGKHWGPPQLIEIIVLIGHYHMVAFFMNATGALPEEGARHLATFNPVGGAR